MRYVLRQKMLSWGDDFTVRDESGQDVLYVDGKVFTIGQKLTIHDMAGNELARIRQRLLAWGPTYEIERGGEVVAIVKKHLFTLFVCKFSVDVPGPDDLEAAGNLFEHEYGFERGGRTVATVSKRWFSWTDTYGIEVAPGEDPVLLIASAVVIDLVCHADEKSRHD